MDINIILPAIITGVVTAFTSILGFVATQKSTKQKEEEARQKQLVDLEQRLTEKLTAHKSEYIEEINKVKSSINEMSNAISEMQAQYQTTVATVTLQIANLEKKQDKHNSVIERTFALERTVGILENRESVSEHRLTDLEQK